MFTRLRDGTVVPFMSQLPQSAFDAPDTVWNYFERQTIKYTWDETYDDAWEEEEPEFEEGELPDSSKEGEKEERKLSDTDLWVKASEG